MLRRLAIALAATALLAGCTDGAPSVEPTPKMPSTSPTTEPTPDGPVEPTPPPEMEGDDAAAAEAFVEYYFALLTYAQQSGDTDSLDSVAIDDCDACRGSLEAIENVYRSGSIQGGEYEIRRVRAHRQGSLPGGNTAFTAEARVHNKKMVITGAEDPSLNGESKPSTTDVDLLLVTGPDGWQMTRWSLQ